MKKKLSTVLLTKDALSQLYHARMLDYSFIERILVKNRKREGEGKREREKGRGEKE